MPCSLLTAASSAASPAAHRAMLRCCWCCCCSGVRQRAYAVVLEQLMHRGRVLRPVEALRRIPSRVVHDGHAPGVLLHVISHIIHLGNAAGLVLDDEPQVICCGVLGDFLAAPSADHQLPLGLGRRQLLHVALVRAAPAAGRQQRSRAAIQQGDACVRCCAGIGSSIRVSPLPPSCPGACRSSSRCSSCAWRSCGSAILLESVQIHSVNCMPKNCLWCCCNAVAAMPLLQHDEVPYLMRLQVLGPTRPPAEDDGQCCNSHHSDYKQL